MSNRFKPKDRVLPVQCNHLLSADWFRRFTLSERIRILFGFNLIVLIRIPTQHHPGQFKPVVAGHTTKFLKPDDIMLEKMQAVLDGETLQSYQGAD